MPVARSRFLLCLLALLAGVGTFWQTVSGSLEHLGVIPHAHLVAVDFGDDGTANPNSEHGGYVHHHHLSDLSFSANPVLAMLCEDAVSGVFERILTRPEAPAPGIDYPPQRG